MLFVLNVGTEPGQVVGRALRPWLVIHDHAALAPLWTASEILQLLVLVAAVVGLVVRYRRGDEQRRRQLLWLVLALVLTIVVLVPWGLFDAGPILQLLAIALIPAAMTIAVLRHQLLDIRLVLSRTVLYVLLTVGVVGVYLTLVAVADVLLRREGGLVASGPGTSVLATLVIAVGFNPVRVRLQRVVDRALYGDRADPVRALSRMGERLRAGTEPDDVLVAVAEALRLPYVAVRRDGEVTAAHGTEPMGPATTETLPLRYHGEDVGELVVGVRRGQRVLQHADRAALELLAVPLAVAVHATRLSAVRAARAGGARRRPGGGTTPPAPRSPRRPRARPHRDRLLRRRRRQRPDHPTRRGRRPCCGRCGPRPPTRSTTSAASSTPSGRPPSTSSAWSGRSGATSTGWAGTR